MQQQQQQQQQQPPPPSQQQINVNMLVPEEKQTYLRFTNEFAKLSRLMQSNATQEQKKRANADMTQLSQQFNSWKQTVYNNQNSNRLQLYHNKAVFHHNPLMAERVIPTPTSTLNNNKNNNNSVNNNRAFQNQTNRGNSQPGQTQPITGSGPSASSLSTPQPLYTFTPLSSKSDKKESNLDKLLSNGNVAADQNLKDILLNVADNFIDQLTLVACKLALHRNSRDLLSSDLQFPLERNWNVRIPGYLENRVLKTRKDLPTYVTRSSHVKKCLKDAHNFAWSNRTAKRKEKKDKEKAEAGGGDGNNLTEENGEDPKAAGDDNTNVNNNDRTSVGDGVNDDGASATPTTATPAHNDDESLDFIAKKRRLML